MNLLEIATSLMKNSLFLMSLTVGFGVLLGRITVRGINMGISGALFVGLFFGAAGYSVPSEYFTWNLMFFVVAVGLLAAEDTARVIRRYGTRFVLLSIVVTGAGALATLAAGLLFSGSASPYMIAGTYTGALTSSPGLGAALEATANNPDVALGYSIAYPFGVMAVVLFVQLAPAIFGMDVAKEREELARELEDGSPSTAAEESRSASTPFSLLSFVLCIVGGTVIGEIEVPLGSLGTVSLGTTGGALLFALFAGSFDHIGPLPMRMDKGVLSAIRSISLGYFLAVVGLNAGGGALKAFLDHGPLLIAVGIGAALAAELAGFFLGRYVFKINWIILAGAICGAMTSTPGLAAAIDATGTDECSAGYGAAYPVAIVCMVVFTTMLAAFFRVR
ncbi:MAG: YidE/YbjL duplication [Synergistaceae bacterium]|nr:YidE/YbjL duplication [Synergistaceae bacterium]